MALVECTECGKEISDKAVACPNCGCPVEPNLQDETIFDEGEEKVSENDVESQKKSRDKKLNLLIFVTVLIGAVAMGLSIYHQNIKNQRAEYIETLDAFAFDIIYGAAEVETTGNMIHSIWKNCIMEIDNAETDPYTKGRLGFHTDFNTALSGYFSSEEYIVSVSAINVASESVNENYLKLQNPSEEFESVYEVVDELYDAYNEFAALATSPSGSLQSYTADFNKLDAEVLNLYQKLNTLIPEE